MTRTPAEPTTPPISIRITCELADETGFVSLELCGMQAEQLLRIARNIVEQAAPIAFELQAKLDGDELALKVGM